MKVLTPEKVMENLGFPMQNSGSSDIFPTISEKAESKINSKEEISQWVKSVTKFSSQDTERPAINIIGPSKIYPAQEDSKSSWEPLLNKGNKGKEFLELKFEKAVYPTRFHVYETFNPGFCVSVCGKVETGLWVQLWQGKIQSKLPTGSVINEKKFEKFNFPISEIRLEFECNPKFRYQIDACCLFGYDEIPLEKGSETSSDSQQQGSNNFGIWFNNPSLSDFTIINNNKQTYPCHRFILANASQKLLNICNNGSDELKVSFDKTFLKMVLKYIYTGRYNLNIPHGKNLKTLIYISDYFGLVALRKACFESLLSTYSPEEILETLLKAQEKGFDFECHDLVLCCVKSIEKQAHIIFEGNQLLQLNFETMKLLCLSDGIIIDDYVLFSGVIKWCQNKEKDSNRFVQVAKELLKTIRYPLIPPRLLYELKQNPSYFKVLIPEDDYLEALEFHLDKDAFGNRTDIKFKPRSADFGESTLLSCKFITILMNWLGTTKPKSQWILCYRGSRDGFSSKSFHASCDHVGPTVTIVQSESGNIFGGYNPESWTSTKKLPSTSSSEVSFLFTFTNSENLPPTKFPQIPGYSAVKSTINCGPSFGENFDLFIANMCDANASSYSNLGQNYDCSIIEDKTVRLKLLGGSHNFKVKELEIFKIGTTQ